MSRTSLDRALEDPAVQRLLPEAVADLLRHLDAPPRLAAHLRAVHDVASQLVEAEVFAALPFDRDEVLFGAATHDILGAAPATCGSVKRSGLGFGTWLSYQPDPRLRDLRKPIEVTRRCWRGGDPRAVA